MQICLVAIGQARGGQCARGHTPVVGGPIEMKRCALFTQKRKSALTLNNQIDGESVHCSMER